MTKTTWQTRNKQAHSFASRRLASPPGSGASVKSVGKQATTLEEKLALFDPVLHGGEIMVTSPLGLEQLA